MTDPEDLQIMDYNSKGVWSPKSIEQRYLVYCQTLKIAPNPVTPLEHRVGNRLWIYPGMSRIVTGIEAGDLACICLGVDFLEEDSWLPFGKLLKCDTARALRRTSLNEEQKERIRKRVVTMLLRGKIPHELREYTKLLKKVGYDSYREHLAANLPRDNPHSAIFYRNMLGL